MLWKFIIFLCDNFPLKQSNKWGVYRWCFDETKFLRLWRRKSSEIEQGGGESKSIFTLYEVEFFPLSCHQCCGSTQFCTGSGTRFSNFCIRILILLESDLTSKSFTFFFYNLYPFQSWFKTLPENHFFWEQNISILHFLTIFLLRRFKFEFGQCFALLRICFGLFFWNRILLAGSRSPIPDP